MKCKNKECNLLYIEGETFRYCPYCGKPLIKGHIKINYK